MWRPPSAVGVTLGAQAAISSTNCGHFTTNRGHLPDKNSRNAVSAHVTMDKNSRSACGSETTCCDTPAKTEYKNGTGLHPQGSTNVGAFSIDECCRSSLAA